MKRGAFRHGSTSRFAYAPALGLALGLALATPAALQAQEAPEDPRPLEMDGRRGRP